MSRKEVSMIGNLTRDMMRDVMETSLKKPIQTGEFRKNPVEPAWRCPGDYIYELVPTEKFVMELFKAEAGGHRPCGLTAPRRRLYWSDEKHLSPVCGKILGTGSRCGCPDTGLPRRAGTSVPCGA